MACLDAHLYEIEYKCQLWPKFHVRNSTNRTLVTYRVVLND
jgi:hypothetical protein